VPPPVGVGVGVGVGLGAEAPTGTALTVYRSSSGPSRSSGPNAAAGPSAPVAKTSSPVPLRRRIATTNAPVSRSAPTRGPCNEIAGVCANRVDVSQVIEEAL
jgi:hypothetical protein